MNSFKAYMLELGALLSLCLVLSIFIGVPALWSLLGTVILFDLGAILFLVRRPAEPGKPFRVRVCWYAD